MREFRNRVDLTTCETAAVTVAITDKIQELDALLKATQKVAEAEEDVKRMKALRADLDAALKKIFGGALVAL